MSSKDKEVKTLEKLKQFFRINKGGAGNLKGRIDFALTHDIEKDLGPETPLNNRLKNIKDLSEAVLNNRLEDNSIEKLWQCLQDLLHRDVPKDARHQVFAFFRCLVQGQYEKLGLMRVHFFRIIKSEDLPDDVGPRLDLLVSLTDNGKDILYLEEEIGPFMLQWMPTVVLAGKSYDFMAMLVNVIKYNASLIDEYVVRGLVENTCWLTCHTEKKTLLVCLDVLDTVVCYTNLPAECLQVFITALCRSVSYEQCVNSSWKVMRNLLGTHMGHAALYTMCRILQRSDCLEDVRLLRGAVFYINMGLWGAHRVPNLKYTATSVLPSLLHALECNERLVVYEVMLSIQRLVSKYGLELHDPAWDLVLSIIEAVITYIETSEAPQPIIVSHLHDCLNTIEQLVELGQFNGSVRRLFQLNERCSTTRPEASVLRLVGYLSSSLVPTRSMWLGKLNALLDRYLKLETRTNIRVKVMDILTNIIHTNRAIYEDELIERIVVPHLQHIDQDPDPIVRTAAAQLLVDLCLECETKRCLELLDILQKILNRPFEQHALDSLVIITETEVLDVKTAITGLVKIFTTKLYQLPSIHAIKAYKLLVSHLEAHYLKPSVFEHTSSIRYMIFECFLHLRANSLCHLGFQGPGPHGLLFSPYLGVDHKEGSERGGGAVTPPPMSPAPTSHPTCTVTYLSMTHACKAVINCLKQEKDWKVVQLILQEVPNVMRNKALILSRHGNDVDLLAAALCSMVSDKNLCLPDILRNTPLKFTRSEFHAFVFPVLASLASYHAYLEPSLQQRLIKCMEVGLNSRQCARQCVTALTTCILEMRDAMYKLLPEVLLNLSKISATTYIAVPILEFLSTLTRLPKVFASFVGDQYMSVFAISLPYTNPFKYNHYTVSLAHHVIAVWFLKCRLPFRRDFVKFITTGLKANVLVPFEEGQLMKTELVNEDSSNRKRASSLTEQGSRRQVRPIIAGRVVDMKPPIDEALMTFHVELTETCIDLMARYTFNTCSALPKRHPTAEFLLNGGQSMTWLLGNKLITVTTSGCSQKALKNGLCDKCWLLCKAEKIVAAEPLSPDVDAEARRRGKPALSRTISSEVTPLPPLPAKEPPVKEPSGVNVTAMTDVPSRLTKQLSIDINPRTMPIPGPLSSVGNSPLDETKPIVQSEQPEPSRLDQLLFGSKAPEKEEKNYCACWCQGWAEIYVRRPTGDMSWVIRIQNPSSFQSSPSDFPLEDISTLFLPSLSTKDYVPAPANQLQTSENLPESEYDAILDQHFEQPPPPEVETVVRPVPITGSSVPITIPGSEGLSQSNHEEEAEEYTDLEGKSRNPVRRSNSSPEMSSNWKHPFLKDKKEGKLDLALGVGSGEEGETKKTGKQAYKDPRVSCEAIPEEMAGVGTTPPTTCLVGANTTTPNFLSVHSYPGTDVEQKVVQPSSTVPPSPTNPLSPPSLLRTTPTSITTTTPISQSARATPTSVATPMSVVQSAAVVTSRPPQSPKLQQKTTVTPSLSSPLSLQVEPKNTSPADKLVKEELSRLDPSALSPLSFRDRSHTVSVMSPVRKPRIDWNKMKRDNSPRAKEGPRSGINPSYVFLQLYHNAHFHSTSEKPLLLSQGDMVQRSIKILDHIPPYETHKVGVLYAGQGQASNEAEILRNQFGSLRYAEFLQRLGTLIKLKDADPQNTFLGGLQKDGNDGKFAYIWQDDVMQVTFHVATLMPTKESDPLCNGKKLHIGNDYVTIVYNESGEEYNIQTVKGQFNYACVIIQPLDHATNQVTVKTREELSDHVGHSEPKIVSDQNLAILTRQLALHANLASMISCSLKAKGQDPYASNWLERLRKIKRLRAKVLQDLSTGAGEGTTVVDDNMTSPRSARRVHMDDFTEYT